jgi:hypothetical protein
VTVNECWILEGSDQLVREGIAVWVFSFVVERVGPISVQKYAFIYGKQ